MPWADPGFLERGFIICINEGVALLILSHFSKKENPMKMIEIRLRPNYFIFMEYLGGGGYLLRIRHSMPPALPMEK